MNIERLALLDRCLTDLEKQVRKLKERLDIMFDRLGILEAVVKEYEKLLQKKIKGGKP